MHKNCALIAGAHTNNEIDTITRCLYNIIPQYVVSETAKKKKAIPILIQLKNLPYLCVF